MEGKELTGVLEQENWSTKALADLPDTCDWQT